MIIKIRLTRYKIYTLHCISQKMRLRPLFSSPVERQIINSSKSLHDCPSCRCQSPIKNSINRVPQAALKNIYTQIPFSLKNSRSKGQKKFLEVSQLNSSLNNSKQKDMIYSQQNIKSKYDEIFKETACFKTPTFNRNVVSERSFIKPNSIVLTNRQNPRKNISIIYRSPLVIRSKSQNKIQFTPVNKNYVSNNNESLVIRQPIPQFYLYEQPKIFTKPVYFREIVQKQPSQALNVYYRNKQQASKPNDQMNLSFNTTYEDIPPQPKILLDKKNNLKFKKSSASSSSSQNSNVGIFQKALKFQGSAITAVGSGTSSHNIINEQKQQIKQIQTKGQQKLLKMNKKVKGKSKNLLQYQADSQLIKDKSLNKKQSESNDSESQQTEQIANQYIQTVQRSEKNDQFSNTKQNTQDSAQAQCTVIKRYGRNEQQQNSFNKLVNKEIGQMIKRTLPLTQTTKTIQVELNSKSDPINTPSKIGNLKDSLSSGYRITSLQKIIDTNQQSSDGQSVVYVKQSKKNNFQSRFPNFKKKREEYAQERNYPQQQYSCLKGNKSRSKSNEDRSRKNSVQKIRQQSKNIVQQSVQSMQIATQLMQQLKLYYQYYQARGQSDSSIERNA